MSKLAEYRRLEQQLAAQLAELDTLKNDDSLKKEIEFEEKLQSLLGEYGMGLKDIMGIFGEAPVRTKASAPTSPGKRRERTLKRYKNPHNGETIETKGGNHKVLKAWKDQYGKDEVESWVS